MFRHLWPLALYCPITHPHAYSIPSSLSEDLLGFDVRGPPKKRRAHISDALQNPCRGPGASKRDILKENRLSLWFPSLGLKMPAKKWKTNPTHGLLAALWLGRGTIWNNRWQSDSILLPKNWALNWSMLCQSCWRAFCSQANSYQTIGSPHGEKAARHTKRILSNRVKPHALTKCSLASWECSLQKGRPTSHFPAPRVFEPWKIPLSHLIILVGW